MINETKTQKAVSLKIILPIRPTRIVKISKLHHIWKAINIPIDVATPLPPLAFRNGDQLCPITHKSATVACKYEGCSNILHMIIGKVPLI